MPTHKSEQPVPGTPHDLRQVVRLAEYARKREAFLRARAEGKRLRFPLEFARAD